MPQLPLSRLRRADATVRAGLTAMLLGAALLAPSAALSAQPALAIPHEKFTLPNGLEVILHVDRSVPIVAVNTWYKVGSGDERPGRTGFAHLFEHIMFMGSQHVPVGKFDEWLEAAGGSNNGSTNFDRTNYYETGPSNALPLMLWLDADRMGFLLPTMDQAKLDLQRDVVKNERRQNVENVPYGRFFETVLPVVYPAGHPYSWEVIGSMADLSAATLDDVTRFFRTYYAPNNASITIAGDFAPDSARAWVTRWFADIPRADAPVRPTVARTTLARDTVLVLEDRVQLPRVYQVWPSVPAFHRDDAALSALAQVLAGGRSSRLYASLVRERQAMQDVSAFQYANKLDGLFIMSATARPGEHPRVAVEAMTAEVARIANEGVTPRELERVKNAMRAQMLDELSSVLGKADRLNYYNYFVGTPDYLAQDMARWEALTVDDLKRAARALQSPRVVLTIVPQGKRELAVTEGLR
ncbi:MAG TPA: pitrilysin family protein [Gemmatimonadaceae bacterium]|nr:pitrilysin family protein [Gemmatimonadaceae bacterium]